MLNRCDTVKVDTSEIRRLLETHGERPVFNDEDEIDRSSRRITIPAPPPDEVA